MEACVAPKGCRFCFCLAADFLQDGASDAAALMVCVHSHPAQLKGTIQGFRQRCAAHGITGIIGCQYVYASGGVINIELRGAPWAVGSENMPADIDEALQHLVIRHDGNACSFWRVMEMYEEIAFRDGDDDWGAGDAVEGAIPLPGDERFIQKWPGDAAGTDAVDGSE